MWAYLLSISFLITLAFHILPSSDEDKMIFVGKKKLNKFKMKPSPANPVIIIDGYLRAK